VVSVVSVKLVAVEVVTVALDRRQKATEHGPVEIVDDYPLIAWWIFPVRYVSLHNYGKSPCLMENSRISMAIFNSYVQVPEGTSDSY
jgi:hypothetical protein